MNSHSFVSIGLIFFLFAASSSTPQSAWAEEAAEDATARARELFGEGVELSDAENWSEASERFEQALELRDAPTIRFNLANCYSELGRLTEALEHLQAVLDSDETTGALRTNAEALLAEIEPRLGHVEISRGEVDWNAQLLLDGEEISAEQVEAPIAVDPGSHVITATFEGQEVARNEVEATSGETTQVTLEPSAEIDADITPTPDPDDDDGDGGRRETSPLLRDWRLWTGVGAGVVVIITAIAIGVGVSNADEYEDPVRGNMSPAVLTWR